MSPTCPACGGNRVVDNALCPLCEGLGHVRPRQIEPDVVDLGTLDQTMDSAWRDQLLGDVRRCLDLLRDPRTAGRIVHILQRVEQTLLEAAPAGLPVLDTVPHGLDRVRLAAGADVVDLDRLEGD